MAQLNVKAVDQAGNPAPGKLVTVETALAIDWGQPGIRLFPSERVTGPDGTVNFYNGPKIANPLVVSVACMNGVSFDPAAVFDGTKDVTVTVVAVPFD